MKTGNLQQPKLGRDLRKRRKVLIVLLGLGLLACVWIAVYMRETGPVYNGKHLSEWLKIYDRGRELAPPLSAEGRESGESIRQIGSNAVPLLLDWIDYEPLTWEEKHRYFMGRFFRWMPRRVSQWLNYDRAAERSRMAMYAFQLLGDEASSAIPELARRVSLTNSVEKRNNNFGALSHLGPAAVPTATTILSNPEVSENYMMFGHITNLGTNARPFVPLLVKYLQHTNLVVAVNSAYVLGDLKLEPELAVPALVSSLSDPRPVVENAAMRALYHFGAPARPALPAVLPVLLPMLSHTNPVVRDSATFILRTIAPELLTNAPGNIPVLNR